jgi:amino acid adenylation domain-containing protein
LIGTRQFLHSLHARGVRVWAEGKSLRYRAPKGALTSELRASVLERKSEILQVLREAHAPGAAEAEPIEQAPRSGPLPLSFAQQRVWFLSQMEGGASPYHEQGALRISGPLNVAALQGALVEIVNRHEALRTTFHLVNGSVTQHIEPAGELCFEVRDLGADEPVEQAAEAELERVFDLERGPLLRIRLLRLTPHSHVLLLTVHHIVSDGWSIGIFTRELAVLYTAHADGGSADLEPLPVQYADFAWWQRGRMSGENRDRLLAYWKRELEGAPPVLELPFDRPRPAIRNFDGAVVRFRIPAELAGRTRERCRETGSTLFMALLASFATLLLRYGAGEDLVIGTPIANRPRPEFERLIGFFANTLALRIRLEGAPTFRELLGRVRRIVLGAWEHQELPFEQIVEELHPARDLSHSPIFQAMCVLQNAPAGRQELPGLELAPLKVSKRRAKFDLTLVLEEDGDAIDAEFEYSSALFDRETVERMRDHFLRLLDGLIAHPELPVSRVPLMRAVERSRVLTGWNRTAREWPGAPLVHRMIEDRAAQSPDAPAVSFRDTSWTYRELNSRANQVARKLARLGAGRETIVCVHMERSLEIVAALLGVLKVGAAYLPLEPSYPAARKAFVLDDARPAVVLTQARLANGLPAGTALVALDAEWDSILQENPENPDAAVQAEDAAYVIYTSGSTGQPKGAINTHAGLRNRLLWMQDEYQLDSTDAVVQKTPISFDVSVWEFLWPLLSGARLIVAEPGGHQDAAYLLNLIREREITTVHFVPSMLRAFLEQLDGHTCVPLRRVFSSGEALTPDIRDLCFATLPAELHNLYGPTEASIDVTAYRCRRDDRSAIVPIGRPIANLRLYILDEELEPVPAGVPGELYIAGAGVARGYLNRPELTAERFLPDPFSGAAGARMYKTGDRARHLPSGEIEYLGRLDSQVKIRGYRIELAEIEAALMRHPQVSEAAAVAWGDANSRRLAAYVVSGAGPDPTGQDLRRFLRDELPEYMIPAAFVFLPSLPLNHNGKLDRRALPSPESDVRSRDEQYTPPATAVEELLCHVWETVLEVRPVGVCDNFFDRGGDSIRAIQVVAQARNAGLPISVQQLFQAQTVRELAAIAVQGEIRSDTSLPGEAFALVAPEDRAGLPAGCVDAYPLAALQAGMLFHGEYQPQSAVYHDVFSFDILAAFQECLLQETLGALLQAHETLRTGFAVAGYSVPLQIVYRSAGVPLSVTDLRRSAEDEQREAIELWVEREKQTPFDWTRPPLIRFQVHRCSEDRFHLTLSFHHAIVDGWSVASLVAELLRDYAQRLAGMPGGIEPPRTRFRDAVALERLAVASSEHRDYWERNIRGAAMTLLPRGGEAQHGRDGVHEVAVAPAVSGGLKEAARAIGVPLKSVLLAVHLRVLSFLCNQADVVTGVVSNGRPEQLDAERALGLFLNTLPCRVPVEACSWSELARAAFQSELKALPYRRYPLAEMQLCHGGPLFETLFNFVHFHVHRRGGPEGVEVLGARFFEKTNFTLMTTFSLDLHTSEVRLSLNYDGAALGSERIARIGEYYRNAMEQLAGNPEARCDARDLLPEAERQRVLRAWNHTAREIPVELRIHDLFEAQARQTPDAPAVVFDGRECSYRELDERAERLAALLRGWGVGPESLVGVCLARSEQMVVALLAVLKAGGAYVPLDPAYPEQRLGAILEDARPAVLLTGTQWKRLFPGFRGQVLCLDEPHPSMAPGATLRAPTSANLAYVLYTSGSTGKPKGVAIEHRSAVAFLHWAREVYSDAELRRVLASTSICFDLSFFELFAPLSWGGAAVLVENALRLPDLPAGAGVTLVNTVPSAMAALLRTYGLPASVKTVNLAGEPLPLPLARKVYEVGTVERLYNLYGPTEDTTYSTFALVSRNSDEPPNIGRPIANTQAYILDRNLQPVPAGTPGELCLGGAGLARGYLGDPERTRDRFLPDPHGLQPGGRLYRTGDLAAFLPSGEIRYLGRLDKQVKIRGFRVELGEVETALRAHHAVRDAAVSAWTNEEEDKHLVACVVPRTASTGREDSPLTRELREHLQSRLPAYMVPSYFLFLDELPLTPNGKIDYLRLPQPDRVRAASPSGPARPPTDVEQKLAALFAETLGLAEMGIHDSFFEKGGHSLLATRLVARIRSEFHVNLPLAALFEAPTVAGLAERIGGLSSDSPTRQALPECVVPLARGRSRPILFCLPPAAGSPLCYLHLVRHIGDQWPVYGFQSPGLLEGGLPLTTVEAMAADYLRALRAVQPAGPYWIAGWSFGGLLAIEMARQLRAANGEIAFLGLLDSGAFDSAAPGRKLRPRDIWRMAVGLLAIATHTRFPTSYREFRFILLSLGLPLPESPRALGLAAWRNLFTSFGRSWRVTLASYRAGAKYAPTPFAVHGTLFRAAPDGAADLDDSLVRGTGKICAEGLTVRPIRGNHMSIVMDDRLAARTAAELRTTLEDTFAAGDRKLVAANNAENQT